MRNSAIFFIGFLLIFFGVLALFSQLLNIDFGSICWPAGLILIGLWILIRPRMMPAGVNLEMRLLGDVKRRGAWTLQNEEFWSFVGDTKLDLSEAQIPPGETKLNVYGFVGNIRLRLPADVGLAIQSTAFLNETKILGDKQSTFIAPFEYTSPGYESADRKIRLESWFFVADVKVEQSETLRVSENP